MIYSILDELDWMYNLSDDPRYKGEAPECMDLMDKVLEEFKKMSGDEIQSILESRIGNQLEQLIYPMEEIEHEHDFVKTYLKKVMG